MILLCIKKPLHYKTLSWYIYIIAIIRQNHDAMAKLIRSTVLVLYSSYAIVTRTLILIGVRFRTTVPPATPPSPQPTKSAAAATNYCRNFCNSTKFFGTVTVATVAGENSRPQNAYPTRIIRARQSVTRANHAWLFTAAPLPPPPRTTYNVVIILFRCQTAERLDLCGPGKQLPPKTRRATCELKQKRREDTRQTGELAAAGTMINCTYRHYIY